MVFEAYDNQLTYLNDSRTFTVSCGSSYICEKSVNENRLYLHEILLGWSNQGGWEGQGI